MPASTLASTARHFFKSRDARLLENTLGQLVGENEEIAVFRPVVSRCINDPVETVGDLRRKADRAVAGQRPGRRGPDHDRCFSNKVEGRCDVVLIVAFERNIRDRKLHPDLIAGVVLVLDLRFRQRGLLDHAPHHRLRAAVQRAVGGELHQLARDLRLGEEIHRRVGMRPVALDAEALEFLALHVEPVVGIGAALLPERDHRGRIGQVRLRLVLGAVVLFLDLPFDRQAVAVPARDVVGIEAEHLLAARHHVLENLVERMPDMDVAVRVRRAVVQDEFIAALSPRRATACRDRLFPSAPEFPARVCGNPARIGNSVCGRNSVSE